MIGTSFAFSSERGDIPAMQNSTEHGPSSMLNGILFNELLSLHKKEITSDKSKDEYMPDDLAIFSSRELKDVVQDMRDLLSQSQLGLLLGAGCSKIAGLPRMPHRTPDARWHSTTRAIHTKTLFQRL